jgi:ubiquinone/menaquinone biosynthesis C-methylase UbiE
VIVVKTLKGDIMSDTSKIKEIVKGKYAKIAVQAANTNCCSCCQPSESSDYSVFNDDYSKIEGYVKDADLGLGCGLPTAYAGIKPGDAVLDLGSGAGNDVFVARKIVGENGKVVGLDMTEEMIEKANWNKQKLGYNNVEFRLGDIERLPLEDNIIDVVISNCVLNLVPDKQKAFSEIYRVLKSGAHFCISDVVIKGELPEKIKESAEMYAGCVAGALNQEQYLGIIEKVGFKRIEIKTSKEINLPEEVLRIYIKENEIEELRKNKVGIFSITVVGYK